jgi:hypothetical protein
MTRAIALVPIVALAGLPVLLRPSSGHAAAALAAAALCAAGVLARWRPLVTAGGSLTLIQYTVALASRRMSPASAVALGVSLALVLDVSEFAGRFHGLAPSAPVLGRQARHWIASALLGALAAAALAILGALVRIGGPPALPPLLGALGALAAAVGVAGAVWRRRQDDG